MAFFSKLEFLLERRLHLLLGAPLRQHDAQGDEEEQQVQPQEDAQDHETIDLVLLRQQPVQQLALTVVYTDHILPQDAFAQLVLLGRAGDDVEPVHVPCVEHDQVLQHHRERLLRVPQRKVEREVGKFFGGENFAGEVLAPVLTVGQRDDFALRDGFLNVLQGDFGQDEGPLRDGQLHLHHLLVETDCSLARAEVQLQRCCREHPELLAQVLQFGDRSCLVFDEGGGEVPEDDLSAFTVPASPEGEHGLPHELAVPLEVLEDGALRVLRPEVEGALAHACTPVLEVDLPDALEVHPCNLGEEIADVVVEAVVDPPLEFESLVRLLLALELDDAEDALLILAVVGAVADGLEQRGLLDVEQVVVGAEESEVDLVGVAVDFNIDQVLYRGGVARSAVGHREIEFRRGEGEQAEGKEEEDGSEHGGRNHQIYSRFHYIRINEGRSRHPTRCSASAQAAEGAEPRVAMLALQGRCAGVEDEIFQACEERVGTLLLEGAYSL